MRRGVMNASGPVGQQGIHDPLDGLASGLHHLMGYGLIEGLTIPDQGLDAGTGIGRT